MKNMEEPTAQTIAAGSVPDGDKSKEKMDFMRELYQAGKAKSYNYSKATDEIDAELAALLGDQMASNTQSKKK